MFDRVFKMPKITVRSQILNQISMERAFVDLRNFLEIIPPDDFSSFSRLSAFSNGKLTRSRSMKHK